MFFWQKLKSWQIKFCTTFDLCYFFKFVLYMAKKWKKRLFLSKNDLSWAKNQKSFRSMVIFLLLWFVVFKIEGFEHQSVHWRPQIYGSHWPKTKKLSINTPEYRFHMVCSHFFWQILRTIQQIWDLLNFHVN